MTVDTAIKLLGLLGGFAGAITLGWRLVDVFKAYLHVELTVDQMGGRKVKLRTMVHNTNTIARKLDAAFLVIGPAEEAPDETVAALFKKIKEPLNFPDANQMVRAISERIQQDVAPLADDSGRMMIPLPFYYIENVDVADEKLSFEEIIDCAALPAGAYGVRFYIEAAPRLHRLVHAAFDISVA
jgi:hypothetical protein